MKNKIKIVILLIVVILGFCFGRDYFIKSLIGTVATNITGAPVHIGGLSLSSIRQAIKITNFRMYNPQGFPKDVLVDIPKIHVACDIGALVKGKIHLSRIDFELKELIMVKNRDGKLNVDSLKIIEAQREQATAKEAKKPAKALALQIDLANLAIGRIVSKDYSVSSQPVVKVYEVNLNKSYKNITSAQQLAVLIISEPLKAAGIRGLKIYAVSMLTGVAALPVAAVLTLGGKDYARVTFEATLDKVYNEGLQVLKEMGLVKKENKAQGIINAEVAGAHVILKLKKINDSTTEVTVSARRFELPKPEIASGVIYQLQDKLK